MYTSTLLAAGRSLVVGEHNGIRFPRQNYELLGAPNHLYEYLDFVDILD
jgi:hypothetical protein